MARPKLEQLEQIIQGDYVFTPIPNAFNKEIAYWVSKKGYTVAVYCFTAYTAADVRENTTQESLDNLKRLFDTYIKQIWKG